MVGAWRLVRPRSGAGGATRDRRRLLWLVLAFGALFRLLLLPAGLPEPPLTLRALVVDVTGERSVYGPFLLYDDDVWRYLWDGHASAVDLAHGHFPRPWSASPAERAEASREARALLAGEESGAPAPGASTPGDLERQTLEHRAALLEERLWRDVLDDVRFPTVRSVYPPLAQAAFLGSRWLAPGSVFVWKLLLVLADLATCLLLVRLLVHLGRPRELVVLYAWSPLAIQEIAGSGHVDALMVLLLVAAVERLVAGRTGVGHAGVGHTAAGLGLFGASVAAKLTSLPLAPVLLRRAPIAAWWTLPAVLALLFLPFAPGLPDLASALGVFAEVWVFNPGLWQLLVSLLTGLGVAGPTAEALAHGAGRALVVALVVAVTLGLPGARRRDRRAHRLTVHAAFLVLAATVLTGAAVMPWYLLWALPFAVATPWRGPWTLLTALAFLSYLVYSEHAEHAWWLWVEHGGFALAAAFALARNRALAGELRELLPRFGVLDRLRGAGGGSC